MKSCIPFEVPVVTLAPFLIASLCFALLRWSTHVLSLLNFFLHAWQLNGCDDGDGVEEGVALLDLEGVTTCGAWVVSESVFTASKSKRYLMSNFLVSPSKNTYNYAGSE